MKTASGHIGRVRIFCDLSHAAWKALADRQRLRQVLLNLISNAVKYNVAGGTVRLSGRYTGDATLRLEVTDTGPGIAPEIGRAHV